MERLKRFDNQLSAAVVMIAILAACATGLTLSPGQRLYKTKQDVRLATMVMRDAQDRCIETPTVVCVKAVNEAAKIATRVRQAQDVADEAIKLADCGAKAGEEQRACEINRDAVTELAVSEIEELIADLNAKLMEMENESE